MLVATLVMQLFGAGFTAAPVRAFSGGDGSAEAPYRISTCLQLQDMNNDRNAHYELVADVDCGNPAGGNDTTTWNDGAGFAPIGDCWGPGFGGTLNGNGHTISNLYIHRPTTDRQALIGCTNNGADIEDLGLVNVDITGQRYAGSFAGVLVGADTVLRNVYASGSVALVYGEVMGSGQFAGGLVSGMEGGSHIYTSYSVVDVSTYYHDYWGEGGISGYAYGGSTVSDSFWNTETPSTVLISEGGGTGKTTAQMKTESTYTDADWDFTEVWDIDGDYPFLRVHDVSPAEDSADLTSAEDGSPITLAETGCTAVSSNATSKESSHEVQDPAYSYPAGFVDFTLTGCASGGDATITAVFTGSFDPANVTLRKYNPTLHSYTTLTPANSGLALTSTTLSGQPAIQAVYHVTDGGAFDQDGEANGTIVDPVGLGSAVVTAPNTGL